MTKSIVAPPFVVDLERALLRADLQQELALQRLVARGAAAARMFDTAASAPDASDLQDRVDPAGLAYDADALELIAKARAEGRRVYLAGAAAEREVQRVADHLNVFDGVFGASAAGEQRARMLAETFGERGFDYLAGPQDSLAECAHARRCYGVRLTEAGASSMRAGSADAVILPAPVATWRTYARALRVHQYAKNLLLFVPILTAHRFDLGTFVETCLALVAFCLCASSVYIVNDLADLKADRRHPTKRLRPFASGDLPLRTGAWMVALLLAGATLLAALVSASFLLALAAYLALTTLYTFWLKSHLVIDVVCLAMLYTIRIVAGGVASGIAVSEWLLIFSMFVFTSLALMKRYVELGTLVAHDLPEPQNRDYRRGDLLAVAALAAASALNSVTIFALYLSTSPIVASYSRPWLLWMICPVLLYWLARALMLAHRREMDDDPVIFALRDRVSQLSILAMIALVLFAM